MDTSLDCDSDHLPIAVAIDWSWQPATPSRKRLWAKTNLSLLRQTVQDRLVRVPDATELQDKDHIDEFVRSKLVLMRPHHGRSHLRALFQDSIGNAMTSVEKFNSCVGGGSRRGWTTIMKYTERHVTGRADISTRPSGAPIDRESRKHRPQNLVSGN